MVKNKKIKKAHNRGKIKQRILTISLLVVLFLVGGDQAWAADGSGTATTSPGAVLASSTGNTITVTFTAAETMNSGEVRLTIPTGWSAPQGSAGTAGYTTISSTGTLGRVDDVMDSVTGWAAGTACLTAAPSADTTTKHEGTASISCSNGNEAAGDVWYKNPAALNWSSFTKIGFWIYSSTAIASNNLQFSYDDTTNLASPLESLNVGAISAATWTFVNLTFGATTRTSILSYGFRINNASGVDNAVVKIDDLMVGPYTTPTFAAQNVSVRLLALASSQTVTFTYGSGGGSSGATAPSTLGAHTFTLANRVSDSSAGLTNIASSPRVDVVNAATKVLVGLQGQTVNATTITSGTCPTPGGGITVTIAGTPTAQTANTAFTVCVYATDASNNFASLATNNTSISTTPNDTQGTYPSAANLVNGKGTFSLTLRTAGSYTVTATPTGLTAGTSSAITINPGATAVLVITSNPTSVTAGQQTTAYVVQRRDSWGNPTTSGTQSVNLSSTSSGGNKRFCDVSGCGSPGVTSVTIGAGVSTEDFFYYDELAGTPTIAVAFTGLTGDNKSLTVNPAATAKLVITSNPASVSAGEVTTAYVVERRDQFDNLTTSGSQLVDLSSNSTGSYQFRDTTGGSVVTQVTIQAGSSTEDFFYVDTAAGIWTISVSRTGLTGDFKTLTVTAIPAPGGLGGTAQSASSIKWTWADNSSNEDGFKLYDGSGNLITTIATPNATSYIETGLATGTSYSRFVRAYKGTAQSAASDTATVSTLSPAAFPAEEPAEEPTPEEEPTVEPLPVVGPPATEELTWWQRLVSWTQATWSKTSQSIAGFFAAVRQGTQSFIATVKQDMEEFSDGTTGTVARTLGFFERLGLGFVKFYEIVFVQEPIAISNVAIEVLSPTEVVITWQTNHLATSKVNFGSAVGDYEQSAYSEKQTREHHLTLTGLKPGTTYFYEIISKNRDFAVDAFRSFTTPK